MHENYILLLYIILYYTTLLLHTITLHVVTVKKHDSFVREILQYISQNGTFSQNKDELSIPNHLNSNIDNNPSQDYLKTLTNTFWLLFQLVSLKMMKSIRNCF